MEVTLAEQIAKIRDDAEESLHELHRKLDEDVRLMKILARQEIASLCLSHGKRVCGNCEGVGAVIRMDAGYMRRFGLREWDGCEYCGGDRENKGRGYEEVA